MKNALWFEFHQWKFAFSEYRRLYQHYGDKIRMVISTQFYTSGYWIEANEGKSFSESFQYIGTEVYALEKRIIEEHEAAHREDRGVLFTT